MCFTQLCQCHLEFERDNRPSSSYCGHFSLSKSFDHITKDANIFHLKLGGSCRFSYFLTSTPSKHTIVNLLQAIGFWHINMVDLPQIVDCGHGEIFTTTLSRLDILSLLPFPLFYSFVHFLIYCVFINKALHVFDDIKTIKTKKNIRQKWEMHQLWCNPKFHHVFYNIGLYVSPSP